MPHVSEVLQGQNFLAEALKAEYGPEDIAAVVGQWWKDSIPKAVAARKANCQRRREQRKAEG